MSTPQDRQEGEMPERVNLFRTLDGVSISYDETYKWNVPYVPASRLTEIERKLALARGALGEIANYCPYPDDPDACKIVECRVARDALAELGADKPEPGK